MKKVDFDQMALNFDESRSISIPNMNLWLEKISSNINKRENTTVLDLGCGTGRFAIPMAYQLGYLVTGVDKSGEMLARAKAKDTKYLITWKHEDIENASFYIGSFDIIFISHLLHHVDFPFDVTKRCYNMINKDGSIIIRYGAIEQISNDPEHKFFPECITIDKQRTPSVSLVESWLAKARFTNIYSIEVVQQTYNSVIDRLYAIKSKDTSVLRLISDKCFNQGMHDLELYAMSNDKDTTWMLNDYLTLTFARK